jgi:hypothetical protein
LKSMNNDYQTAFGGMAKLEVLNITNNGIVNHCTANYPNLPALVELNLNKNHLKKLDVKKLIAKFPKLNRISLGGNAWNCDYFLKTLKPQLEKNAHKIIPNDDLVCDITNTVIDGGDDSANVCAIAGKSGPGHGKEFYWSIFGIILCSCAIIVICLYCFRKKE